VLVSLRSYYYTHSFSCRVHRNYETNSVSFNVYDEFNRELLLTQKCFREFFDQMNNYQLFKKTGWTRQHNEELPNFYAYQDKVKVR